MSLSPALSLVLAASILPASNDELSPEDRQGIRRAYLADRELVRPEGDGHVAFSPGQGWRTRFDGRGFTTRPRDGEWTWGLELTSYGFAGQECSVGKPLGVEVDGTQLSYRWSDELTEWYDNGTTGLAHGYTVHRRPAGAERGGALLVEMAVRGDLEARVDCAGVGVSFVEAGGAVVLSYSGLTVFDSLGRTLPSTLERVRGGLVIAIDEAGASYPLTIDPIAQSAYLKRSFAAPGVLLGGSAAISGNTVVLGSPGGFAHVYVFVRSGGVWSQQTSLNGNNAHAGDLYGEAVATNGNTIAVGAAGEDTDAGGINENQNHDGFNVGAVYIFVREAGVWDSQAFMKAYNPDDEDLFGCSLDMSGNTLVVGARGEASSASGVNGNDQDNDLPRSGAAYVFVRNGTIWSQEAYLKASNPGADDLFGSSVSISGNTIVVGAPGEDSSSSGVDGSQNDDSSSQAGAAYVFVRNGSTWSQEAYLKPSNPGAGDQFGSAVDVSGDRAVVGAPDEESAGNPNDDSLPAAGAAYTFVRDAGTWSQQAYLKASNPGEEDRFGQSVSISGPTVAVGASQEDGSATGVGGTDDDLAANSGAVYVFMQIGSIWDQAAYLKASNTGPGDEFGTAVTLDEGTLIVGAPGDDSNSGGVNGDGTNNDAPDSGAAHVFDLGLAVQGECNVRNGSGVNPVGFACGAGPVAGSDWVTTIATSGPEFSILALGVNGPLAGVPLSGFVDGELLCAPPLASDVSTGTHTIPIPPDAGLLGLSFCAQGATFSPGGSVILNNAQDLIIGLF